MLKENLRRLRVEQGYTQETLAKASGVGEKYISAIERGIRDAGKHSVTKLAKALNVSEMALRYGEPTAPVDTEKALLDAEVAGLSPDEWLEVVTLLRKWKRDQKG